MENFQFHLLTYRFEAQIFLREVAPDILTFVTWCGSLQNMFVSHTVPCHTAHHEKIFFVTPLALHMRHLSCISDRVGQCLLPQTSNLATCNSALGGLPSALVLSILVQHVPTYSSRGYIGNLHVKFSYHHTSKEECIYREWRVLTDERTFFLST